jgi:acid phosphatase
MLKLPIEPPFIVTALGLFNTSNASMPADTLNYERAWRTSDILPFLANVGFERMQCAEPAAANNATGTYIRTLINNAPIPLPGCSSGPGASCALSNFTTFVAGASHSLGHWQHTADSWTQLARNSTGTLSALAP